MSDTTARLALPLLEAGQAQKELFHNEALLLLDALVQPVAQDLGRTAPPAAPQEGQAWIVGDAPTGDWSGHAAGLAIWTAGGWRFVPATEGMCVWVAGQSLWARRSGTTWLLGAMPATGVVIGGVQVVGGQRPAIAAPTGGATVDSVARAAVNAILVALRTHGLIAS